MLQHVSITLDLPVNGTGRDYAGAISQAIDRATSRGDLSGTDALAGLLAVLRLSAEASLIAPQNFAAAPRPL
jgi:hypothetical protein